MIDPLDRSHCRTDGGIKETSALQARDRLESSSYPDIRRLNCELREGILTVRGHVRSFYLKQVALALVLRSTEVDHFDDQINVWPASGIHRSYHD